MNDPAPRIVVVGDLTADLIIEVPELPIQADDLQVAEEMHLESGGSANLLILLSRLGAAAVALGTLGKDLWGEQVFQLLENEGVDVSLLRRDGTTTVVLVLVDAAGHHSFVGSYGKGEPLILGDRERQIIAGADALFASGYSLAEERLRDLTLEVLNAAGQRGIPRFFDPGPAFRKLNPDVRKRVLASSDILLLTEDELRDLAPAGVEALLRPGSGNRPAAGPGTESTAAADAKPEAAERSGTHTVVVKRGAAGCRVYTDGAEGADIPGLFVKVRDTTAAGDCFDAGYIWARLKDRSPLECARLANCAGAVAVGKLGGGRNVPTIEELREQILRTGGGIDF
jgi:sugar/nucleoside kinase (ribokinase family)